MKKILIYLLITTASFALQSLNGSAATPGVQPVHVHITAPEIRLLSRLDEINAMDKHNLNSSQKRVLRMEVKSIRTELKAISGGIYLSLGAIIIIILLLIILL